MRTKKQYVQIWLMMLLCAVNCLYGFTCTEVQAMDAQTDSVSIIAVTPGAVIDYTRPITFTVTVEYFLASAEAGTLELSFNTTKSNYFTTYEQEPISAGYGIVTISTTITPVGWGTSDAPKGALGNLWDSIMGRRFQAKATLVGGSGADQQEATLAERFYDIRHEAPTSELELDALVQSTSSTEYSPDLSLCLMQMAAAAYQGEDGMKGTYIQMGFPEESIYGEYTDKPRFEWDSAKYTIGQKFLPSGDSLVLITVRGTEGEITSFSPDWISNFNMGEAYSQIAWHQGFKSGANVLFNYLKDDYFGGNLPKSHTKYVLTGHSRGGAIANLVSVLLMEEGVAQEDLFNYNFACPDVSRDFAGNWNPGGRFDNIFNIGNCSDPVPQLPGLTGDTLPFALDFFAHKDKWYSKVINAVNKTDIQQVYTSWGKYGRSYWFSNDWNYIPGQMPDFLSHDTNTYLKYLSKRPPIDEMKSWTETKALILSGGLSLRTITGIFLCPVDVAFKDPDGNILASVKDGELEFVAADDCCAVVMTDGDKKIIRVQSADEIKVELLGTSRGSMSMVLMEGDPLSSEYTEAVHYENIKTQKGKAIQTVVDPEKPMEEIQVYALGKSGELRAEIAENGKEKRLPGSGGFMDVVSEYIWVIVLALLAVISVIVFVIIKKRGNRKRSELDDLFGVHPLEQEIKQDDDILCSCGTSNPSWAKKCIVCGKKLKKPRRKRS